MSKRRDIDIITFELWRNLVRLVPTVRTEILAPIQLCLAGLGVYATVKVFLAPPVMAYLIPWGVTSGVCYVAIFFSIYLAEDREGRWAEADQIQANMNARYMERWEEKSRIREEKRRGLRY